jgi:Ca-activated chloride channel family protein
MIRALALALLLLLGACDPGPQGQLTIVSGSENQTLEPLVQAYCRAEGWQCQVRYLGSVDIRLALEQDAVDFDAVWPAHGRWIELGDRARRVKHTRSIMTSPVAFGIRDDVADELGLKGRPVKTTELVDRVRAGKLKFLMTSATQSNSGFSAYVGMLTALAGSPEVVTTEMLADDRLRAAVATLLRGVERSAGSSGWLKDLYLEGAREGRYQAMVNYEALLIEANQTLEREGLKPLHLIYPADGTAIADSPLGFVAAGQADMVKKEAFFLGLQAHLLSADVQNQLLAAGRRTGLGGTVANADPRVFRAAWGIDPAKPPPAIRFPAPETIEDALILYQEALRKPSLLGMCLDYSGSMSGTGEASLEAAIGRLFDPEIARRYLIQPSRDDVFIVLPFDGAVRDVLTAKGPTEAAALPATIALASPRGGTDIYGCARQALDLLRERPEWESHIAAVLLMTDGKSQGDRQAFLSLYEGDRRLDVPVFSITFGDADPQQLEELARLTRGRVFDGQKDLEAAFRHARGYN